MRKAVSSVLSAWTNWSVYNSTFIDELEGKFEGREIVVSVNFSEDEKVEELENYHANEGGKKDNAPDSEDITTAVSTTPRGTWTSATNTDDQSGEEDIDGEAIEDLDGESLDDIDGEELDDVDGEELDDIDDDMLDEGD